VRANPAVIEAYLGTGEAEPRETATVDEGGDGAAA
jgi:hypothetical protein